MYTSLLALVFASQTLAVDSAELERIVLSADQKAFVMERSREKFTPWGFNYDHDQREPSGRLLEEYWDEEWETVEQDFREMKELGANVVRIHLQFAAFMEAPDRPNQRSLDQLARLLRLAERERLYLDVTGLGCYHKAAVPAWYDALSEEERWTAQAKFWEAVAARCAASPAVFCYDLMNEPVVAGDPPREDWLAGAFGGKHFVQFITLSAAGRPRPEVARQWMRRMVDAIRKHDPRRLVTVGLVPWSLERPGLTSGFTPAAAAQELDFLAVHLYPQSGKLDESLETLQAFAAAGKPVVIEEIFPLHCDARDLGDFIDRSRPHAAGWIGFYWGKPPREYEPEKSIRDALMLSWFELFEQKGAAVRGKP